MHGKMTSNCTACARQVKLSDPTANLKSLFLETPRHIRHSPLDPTCPDRIADKQAKALKVTQKPPEVTPSSAAIQDVEGGETMPIVVPDQTPVAERATEEDTNMLTSC